MSKNRIFVLSENALHYLDNKDTIRAYSYISSAYTYYDSINSVIDNIECSNIVTTKTIKLNTKLHIAMFALDKEKA